MRYSRDNNTIPALPCLSKLKSCFPNVVTLCQTILSSRTRFQYKFGHAKADQWPSEWPGFRTPTHGVTEQLDPCSEAVNGDPLRGIQELCEMYETCRNTQRSSCPTRPGYVVLGYFLQKHVLIFLCFNNLLLHIHLSQSLVVESDVISQDSMGQEFGQDSEILFHVWLAGITYSCIVWLLE